MLVISKYYIIDPLAACGISVSQYILNLDLNLIIPLSADVDNLKVLYYNIIVNVRQLFVD